MKTVVLQVDVCKTYGAVKRWLNRMPTEYEREESDYRCYHRNEGPALIYEDGYMEWLIGNISNRIVQPKK